MKNLSSTYLKQEKWVYFENNKCEYLKILKLDLDNSGSQVQIYFYQNVSISS